MFNRFRFLRKKTMRQSYLLISLIVCVLLGTGFSETSFEFPAKECAGVIIGNYAGCAAALAQSIWTIHQWGEDTPITVCGNSCIGNLKGRISSWKWKWDAKFQCPDKTQGIVGESTALSRDGAMQHAIEDWINKASLAGKINADDFKC